MADDPRILAMLCKLAEHHGVTGASDYPDDLLRPWYDDRGGRATDTFNLAIEAGLIHVSHDSDTDTSIARITDAGRAAIALHAPPTADPVEQARGDTLPEDVIRLVIAARRVAYESQQPEELKELDEAAEAFADRVPWDDEP